MHKSNKRALGRVALGSALLLSTAIIHPGYAQSVTGLTTTEYVQLGAGAIGGLGAAGGAGGGGGGSVYAGGGGGGGRASGSYSDGSGATAGNGGAGGATVGTYGENVLNVTGGSTLGTVSPLGTLAVTSGTLTTLSGGLSNTNNTTGPTAGYAMGGGAGWAATKGGNGGTVGGGGAFGNGAPSNIIPSTTLVTVSSGSSGGGDETLTWETISGGTVPSDVISIGGSGGGGGGGGDQESGGGGANGSQGGAGQLVIDNGATVVTGDLLIGGNGGGGGGEGDYRTNNGNSDSDSSTPYAGGDGGAGGTGLVQVSGTGSVLEVERYAILGGADGQSGGANNDSKNGGSGGAGASGTLSLANSATLDLGNNAVVEAASQYLNNKGTSSAAAGNGVFNISGLGTINVAGNQSATVEASITDASSTDIGTLVANGGGILMLTAGEDPSGENTYSGGTVIEGGTTVDAESSADLGVGQILLNGGTLQNAKYSARTHAGATTAANAAGNTLSLINAGMAAEGSSDQNLVIGAKNGTVDTNGGVVDVSTDTTNQDSTGGILYVVNSDASSTGTFALNGYTNDYLHTTQYGSLALNAGNGILDLGASTTTSPVTNAVVLDLSQTTSTSSSVGGLDGIANSTINLVASPAQQTLTVNGGGVYEGVLEGSGSLIENGGAYTDTANYTDTSVEILTGNSTSYAGQTTVQSGALVVGYETSPTSGTMTPGGATSNLVANTYTDAASIAGSTVTVDTQGTLQGTLRGYGTVGSTTNNGLVYTGFSGEVPGSGYYGGAPGMLTVDGNYGQTSTGTLEIDVERNKNLVSSSAMSTTQESEAAPMFGYGNLNVEGNATLAGTLAINPGWEAEAGRNYYGVLTTTGTISGDKSFADSIVANDSPYAPYLVVDTTYSKGNANGIGTVQSTTTDNSVNVTMHASQLQINSGRFYAASGFVQNQSLFGVLSAPYTGTVPTANGSEQGYWMRGIGSFGHDDGFDYNYKGFVLGRGFAVNPNLTVGLGLSNVYTNTTGENSSHVNGTSVGGEVYAAYTQQGWALIGTAAAGYLSDKGNRNLPGVGTGKFSPDGAYEGVSGRAQYTLQEENNAFIVPYAQLSYVHTNLGSSTEHFAQQESETGLLSYHYSGLHSSVAQGEAGVDVGMNKLTTHGMFTGWVGLAGLGSLGNKNAGLSETMGLDTYRVNGRVASRGAFAPSIGLQLAGVNAPWSVAADWAGRFASNSAGQSFMLQGNYKW